MASQEAIQHFCTAEMFATLGNKDAVKYYVNEINGAKFINDVNLWHCILLNIPIGGLYDEIFQYVPASVYRSLALNNDCIKPDGPATLEQEAFVEQLITGIETGHESEVIERLDDLPSKDKIIAISILRRRQNEKSIRAIAAFCTTGNIAHINTSNVLEYVTAIHSAGCINDVGLWHCILLNIQDVAVYHAIFQYVPASVYRSLALTVDCIKNDTPLTLAQLTYVAQRISGSESEVIQYLDSLPIKEKIAIIQAIIQARNTSTETKDVIRSAAPVGVRTNSKGAEVVANVYTRVFDNDAEGVFQVKPVNPANRVLYDLVNTTDLPDGTVLPPQTGHTAAVGGLIFLKDEITVNIGTNNPPIICVLTSSNGTGHATLLIQNKGKLYNVGLLVNDPEEGIFSPTGQIIFMSPDVILPTYEQSSQVVWVGLLTNEMVGKMNTYFNACLELEYRIDEHGEVNRSLILKYPVEKAQYLMVAHVTQGKHLNCLSWAQDIVGARLSCMTKANKFVPQPSGCTPVNADDFAKLIKISKTSNYKDAATALIAGMQRSIGASFVERAAFGTVGAVASLFGRGKSKRIKKVNRVKQVKTKNKHKTNKSKRVKRY